MFDFYLISPSCVSSNLFFFSAFSSLLTSFESDATCASDKRSSVFDSYKKIEIMKQKAVTHTKWQIRNTVPGNSFINRQILPSCILSNSELHNFRNFYQYHAG